MESGMMMLAGPSGAGKSQMAMQLAAKLTIGASDWAGYKIDTHGATQKVVYLSLEMNEQGVNEFTDKMEAVFPADVHDVLDKQVLFFASYESFKLDLEPPQGTARRKLEQFLTATPDITGIVVDTLGAASDGGLLDEVKVRRTVSWLKHIRAKYNVWIILLAHTRKESTDVKRREWVLDDIYGVQAIQADLDTAFILHELTRNSILRLVNVKTRYGPKADGVNLRRNSQTLWLERTSEGVKLDEKLDKTEIKDDDDFDLEADDWS